MAKKKKSKPSRFSLTLKVRATSAADLTLAEFREIWSGWDSKQRAMFRKWIAAVSELKITRPVLPGLQNLKADFDFQDKRFSPSVTLLNNATKAWARGRAYTPKELLLEELY